MSSRKEVTTASCKTCGGRPPVDGIGSMSASMISAKGLELTNFINPDLTWKTVSKGYRSSTRRSRKPIDRSPKSDADLQDKGEDTIVSESEKLGVAVLGQRFGDKIEHVPIKKRRFTVQSPSPPPCFSSPHIEVNKRLLYGPYSSDKQSCPKSISKKQLIAMNASKRRKSVEHGYAEDFSGIEILAAAACNDDVGDDVNHSEDNLVVEDPSKEGKDKLTEIETVIEGVKEDSSVFPDNAGENHSGADDNTDDASADKKEGERSVSSRDVRLHWDLNVEMDAWEQPLETLDSQTNAGEDVQVEKLLVFEACVLQKESRDIENDIATPVQPIIKNEDHILEPNSGIDRNEDKCDPTDKARESSMSSDIAAETSQNTSNMLTSLSSCPRSDDFKAGVFSEGTKITSSIDIAVKQVTEDLALGARPSMEVKLEAAACEVDSSIPNEDGDRSATASSLPGDVKSPREMTSSDNIQKPLPAGTAEGGSGGHSELGYKDTSASGVSMLEGQPMVTANLEKQGGEAAVACTCDSKEVLHESAGNSKVNLGAEFESTSHEEYQKPSDCSTSSLARVATEDTCNGSRILDVCGKDQSVETGNVEMGNTTGFDAGYDSQYEDGELRESDVPYWEDDCEEAECVDYGSDTCDDLVDYSMASKHGMHVECSEEEFCGSEVRSIDRDMKVEGVAGPGSDNLCDRIEGDALRPQSVGSKIKTSRSDELVGGSEISPSRIAEASEDCITWKQPADWLDGFDGKDSPAKVVGSGVSRKELPGTTDSVSSDTLHRNDSLFVQRGRSGNLCTQPEEARADHSVGKERPDLQMRCKSPGGVGNPSVSYWDSRRWESPPRHGSFGSDRPRPRSVIESRGYGMHSEAGGAATDNHGHRQAINSFSNGSYRHPLRRRSPINRDDAHNTHRGMVPMRDSSPDRRRFRRYPQGVGRGFREEYQRPLPHNDSDEYSHHVHNRIVRKEQNSSPPPRGPVYYRRPYKRSQSRSRSRSPGAWFVSREQEVKHRSSRSPDYRFEPRMERMRFPFQKQNFGAKYEVGFLSSPRRRFSPHHNNSRWFDDQNGALDNHFRGRRFPARTFQQGQRFDSVGSSRRLNSEDYYEPTMRPARFSEMGRGGGRPRRYDGSDDDRRKHDGRYEIFPRVKRYDSDGVVRRFRFEEEDSFVSRNTHNYNDSDNNNGAERRQRNVYLGELVKRKAN